MDWEKAARRDSVRGAPPRKRKSWRERPTTAKQRAYIRTLERELGRPRAKAPKRRGDAARRIEGLKADRDHVRATHRALDREASEAADRAA